MTYHLGIDLGTTFTAAAVARPDGQVQMAGLGDHGTAVPSVLHLRADGQLLVGEPALRRATEEPDRVARESKRRVGDTTPLVLGGTPVSAELLQGRLARWVVDRVGEREGAWPTSITVTHPASWGAYKLDLLRGALRQVDLGAAHLLPEPVAAATAYAAERDLGPGTRIAVYDLGGGTFDACVLQRADNGRHFEVVGSPEGIDRLGGIDFDEAIFSHVRASLGDALEGLDADDPASRAALVHLRRECVAAKHALSADSDTSIAVLLPTVRTGVRLTRAEFEDMVRPALAETVVALRRSIRSAGVEAADLASVLLVGGSSRIPLVSQLVATELGRPVVVDAHPKDAIALGAAINARDGATAAASPDWQLPHPTVPAAVVAPATAPVAAVPTTTAVDTDLPAPGPAAPDRAQRRKLALAAAAAVVLIALAAGAFALVGRDDGDTLASDRTGVTRTTATETTGGSDDPTTTAGTDTTLSGVNPLAAFDDYTDEAAAAWQTECESSNLLPTVFPDREAGCRCVFDDSRDAPIAFDEFARLGEPVGDPSIASSPVFAVFLGCADGVGGGGDPFADIFDVTVPEDTVP